MGRKSVPKKRATLEDREAKLQLQLKHLQLKKQIRDLRGQMKGKSA